MEPPKDYDNLTTDTVYAWHKRPFKLANPEDRGKITIKRTPFDHKYSITWPDGDVYEGRGIVIFEKQIHPRGISLLSCDNPELI